MTTDRSTIIVGPWNEAIPDIRRVANGAPIPVVSDEKIWALHGAALASELNVVPLLVPPGEDAKCWRELQRLVESLSGINHARSSPVVAFGGGSVGDLAGLAASLYRRGCPLIQMPTTLLAQVDSAVGGKTAIDAAGEKNLVGTFHPADLVVADPAFLATLDDRQMRSGIAEVVKYGAIGNEGFFDALKDMIPGVLRAEPDVCRSVIETCIAAKQEIVDDDPEDLTGRRALLNFGHTFGHAIESELGHGTVLHGEAVAAGMMLAARFSADIGSASASVVERLGELLEIAALPTDHREMGIGDGRSLLPWMMRDKKNSAKGVTLILLERIGKAIVAEDIASDELEKFLAAL